MASPSYIFLTSCYRSGTTLLEKVLHMHPNVIVGSQPFPIIFFMAKERFLAMKKLYRRYPLNHLFLENGYHRKELIEFLDEYTFTEKDLNEFWERMACYKDGLWTPDILNYKNQIRPGLFFDIFMQLSNFLSELFPKKNPLFIGSKEVLCEEFVPYLLSKGVKILVIIRDPRDMITSLNFRQIDNLTGKNRPILYSLRLWRKSVATVLAFEGNNNFFWIRYEDFVLRTKEYLNRLTDFLNIESYQEDFFAAGIFDQYGNLWKGNSSFQNNVIITTQSLGKFRTTLPETTIAFIESCCFSEMKVLNYDFHSIDKFNPQDVKVFREPFHDIHEKFPEDYSYTELHLTQEIERHNKLTKTPLLTQKEKRKWFIYEKSYDRLRKMHES